MQALSTESIGNEPEKGISSSVKLDCLAAVVRLDNRLEVEEAKVEEESFKLLVLPIPLCWSRSS